MENTLEAAIAQEKIRMYRRKGGKPTSWEIMQPIPRRRYVTHYIEALAYRAHLTLTSFLSKISDENKRINR